MTKRDTVNLIRPLLEINKNDLVYLSNYVFGSYVNDPSNENDKFKRVKVRNFINQLGSDGLNPLPLAVSPLSIDEKSKKEFQKNAFTGRIPHCQLITGPEGSGALPMAIAY